MSVTEDDRYLRADTGGTDGMRDGVERQNRRQRAVDVGLELVELVVELGAGVLELRDIAWRQRKRGLMWRKIMLT